METLGPNGIYLFSKPSTHQKVLKDLLQLMRSENPGKNLSFSYVEAETSLHPQLTLFENLQIEMGKSTWQEFYRNLKPECRSLINLLKNPHELCSKAENWEKFIVSLIKGIMHETKCLLIDFNEDLLTPFIISQFKKSILHASQNKTIYLASANSSFWLDSAHSLVTRDHYKFNVESLGQSEIKKHWAS